MKCNDCLQQISSYLDGEIDSELKRTLEEHLRGCHHCEVIFDSTKKTIELYCDGELFQLPTATRDRLHEALRRHWQEKAG